MRPGAATAAPDRHRQPLPDSAARGMQGVARPVDPEEAVAPGAVRDRDVPHPERVPSHARGKGVGESVIRCDRASKPRLRVGPRLAQIVREGRVRPEDAVETVGEAVEDSGGIAPHEAVGGIGEPPPGGGIDVDLLERGREREPVGVGVVAAKP